MADQTRARQRGMATSILVRMLAGAFAALFLAGLFRVHTPARRGHNDFVHFYIAARLVATGELYSAEARDREQRAAIGYTNPALSMVRLPWYAALLRPLGWLPFRAAFVLWTSILVGSLMAAVVLWRGSWKWEFALVSVPAWVSVLQGADIGPTLLVLAACCRLLSAERPFAAGTVLALTPKFHLFVLLPLLLVRKRMWRLAAGLGSGAALLLGLSFLVAGPRWPSGYFAMLGGHPIPRREYMAALVAISENYPHAMPLALALGLATLVLVWRAAGVLDFPAALAPVIAGGALLTGHTYVYDLAVLLLPLLALREAKSAAPQTVATLLLLPVLPIVALVAPPDWLVAVTLPLAVVAAAPVAAYGKPPQRSQRPAGAAAPAS